MRKRFNRFERLLAKLFKAPREVRRPLDEKNSLLWQLADGIEKFEEICSILDSVFNEDISPVIDRTFAGINLLKSKNLMTVLNEPYNGKWNVKKGIIPANQELQDLDPSLGIIVKKNNRIVAPKPNGRQYRHFFLYPLNNYVQMTELNRSL